MISTEFGRLVANILRSRMGRVLFLIHLLLAVGSVGYFWNNFHDPWVMNHALPVWRSGLLMVDWPALPFMRWYVDYFYMRGGGASRLGDAVMMFCISIPWWLYGHVAEVVAARVRGRP